MPELTTYQETIFIHSSNPTDLSGCQVGSV